MKVKQINEIVNSDGGLIGDDDMPQSGANLNTVSKKITDFNAIVGHQHIRDNMYGYFGVTMMPFAEGDENNEILEKVSKTFTEFYGDILKYYYKNPNKLKNDYRVYSENKSISNDVVKHFESFANTITSLVTDKKETSNVDESIIDEVLVDSKRESELSTKAIDREVTDKNVNKIAGLINKLDNKSKDKLKNLIEVA